MKRKRLKNHNDKNQLMMFTDIEMSGEWDDAAHDDAVHDDSDKEDASLSNADVSSSPVELPTQTVKTFSTETANKNAASYSTKELAELVYELSDDEARLVAMHSSLLVHNSMSSDGVYSIPSLPGMKFDKESIQRLAYVSVSRSFPNMIKSIGLDFEDELR